jgi:putative membrane-bound dehydrogenase-like protein
MKTHAHLRLAVAAAVGLPFFADAQNAKPLFASPLVHTTPVAIRVDLKSARELWLVVTDGGDGFTADWADWMEPVLVKADGSKMKLTDLKPKMVKVGYGQLGNGKNAGGQPMKVGGKDVPFGFGAHAPSVIGFDLPAGVVAFEAHGGVDNGGTDQAEGATVVFQVYAQKPPEESLAGGGGGGKPYGLEAAKENMKSFTTPAGLSASLFAAEPMIQNPTNIDIDPHGRVWATECVDYRAYMKLRPEGDRVVILEDTNGDGLADKEKTFFQSPELTNPLGICVIPGPGGGKRGQKVIVSAAPNVWLLTDKDGDDKADESVVLFKVGGVWNYDHQIHAFSFGPDGKFYFNSGNSITELTWPDGTIVKDVSGNEITNKGKPYRQGMVFRCDIDLEKGKASNVETLGWNFRNNYEVAVDSFGAMWQSDNDDDGNKGVRINFVMDFGNYGYGDELTGAGWQTKRTNMETEIPLRHWHQNDPGVVPNLLQTGGGSPTGILVNEGAALGAQFANQIIHCDAGPRVVRAYPLEKSGAGYKATMVDILTSTDSWYRASDDCIAPDGSLFVADWYDPGVGGHAMGDHEAGKIRGRIYRVAAQGSRYAAPAVDFTTAEGCVRALTSPNKATQATAWLALHAMDTKAESALLALWKSQNPRYRARALGLLAQMKGSEAKYLNAGFADADADVRCFAVRLARMMHATRGFDPGVLEKEPALFAKMLKDPSAAVRREMALSLPARTHGEQAWTTLALQHDGKDRWYLEALGIGARGNEEACFDSWLAAIGENWSTPAGRDIIWRMRTARAAGYLARILEDKAVADSEKPRYLRAFDFLPASDAKNTALVELATSGKAADEIAREALTRLKGSRDAGVAAALQGALAKAKGTAQFVELVRDFGAAGQGAALLETALSIPHDPAAVDAVKLLLNDADWEKITNTALAGAKAADLLNLLAASGSQRALARVTAITADAQQKPELRKAAVAALARTQSGAEALVKLAKDGQIDDSLKPAAAAALRLVQYAALKTDIDQLFPAPAALGGKPLAAISDLAKMKGDAVKGKAVFERAESSCITCHRVNDKGVDFAPALTEIGTKLPKEAIFDAIINPNAGISMGFETTQLTLKDGGAGMGIVRSETGDELVLALPGGITQKFAKNTIAKREKLATSMMPSGLNQALTQDDLVDLVEYLASLKKR